MKRQLRGIKRSSFKLDFNLYRRRVPIKGLTKAELSVVDIWPEGAAQTIMFVHGYGGCAETWEYQINHFALSRDFRVVVPDLRGHGQSDAPFSQYTMDEMVQDLYEVYRALELPERFILAGHSFGGSISIEYADTYPDTLDKLILIASAGEYPLPRAVRLLARIPTAAFRPLWRYRPRWNAEIHVMKRMLLNNVRKWQGWSMIRDIQTPALVITGQQDNYFPRYVFDDVGKLMPNAEVYDVGVAKHKVQLERRDAVNRAIERFIVEDNRRSSWRGQSASPSILRQRPWLSSYPTDTPLTVPIPRQPIHKFIESAADWVPKRHAILFYGTSVTYQQLNSQVNQFAHILLGSGLGPKDRIIIVLPNVPQFIIAYYAILKIGGVVVLPNPDADTEQIIKQAKQTDAKAIVTLNSFTTLATEVRDHTSVTEIFFADLRKVMSPAVYRKLQNRWGDQDQPEDDRTLRRIGKIMAEGMMDSVEESPGIDVPHDALACIIYTSGTSDLPKGVCLTHANIVANMMQTRHWIPDLEYGKETFLSVLPMMHSYGMTNTMNIPIAMGATIIMLPVFELQQVLEHIKIHKPTIFPGVPSMYMAINQAPHVRSYNLSSIKACLSGAAPLPVEVQEAFEKLTRGRLVEGYGLTEASPVTHSNPLYGTRKVGSIGIPIPNTDAKIVHLATGEDLQPGQIGELVVRGPQVMQGYLAKDVTDEPESVLKDGWLYTGDVAVMDEDGYFQIISRKRDTIMAGEYSVYPRDVEEVLYENSKVLEAAVVGVPATEKGERIKAFVVPRPGTKLTKEELIALCRRRLDEYAVPWDIEFRENLPKSFVGKVIRRLLIEDH